MGATQQTLVKSDGSSAETARIDALGKFQLKPTAALALDIAREALRLEGLSTGDVKEAPQISADQLDLTKIDFGPQANYHSKHAKIA